MEPIGYIVGTEQNPSTAYHFHFWAKADAGLGIGSVVEVKLDETSRVFGIVNEAYAYNDVPSPLVDYLGRQGVPIESAPTARPEIRVFQAAVLRRIPDEPLGAVGIAAVFHADTAGVNSALGGEKYEGKGIPIGLYGPRENPIPIFADPAYLLGPEAGHLNITGTSGLAAKTSYIEFLLHSIFQKSQESVAAVVFNVKGGDLLFLDHPAGDDFSETDKRMYEICGLTPEPFSNVTYWAPFADETQTELLTLRNNEELNSNRTKGFCYGLNEALENVEILLNKEDIDAKADAFLSYLREDVAGQEYSPTDEPGGTKVLSLEDLVKAIQSMFPIADRNGGNFKSYSVLTIRKIYNRLSNLHLRYKGLISHKSESVKPLPDTFENKSINVVDLSKTDASAQDLIFAATISDLHRRMEMDDLGVRRLIVVVDELNKYAPSGGRETHLLNSLRDISARGRYLGMVLFGAQQFRSRVDPQVVGNCANSAYGHIQLEELSGPNYTVYSQAVREKLATADPGMMMVRHPHFSQPVFVRFPRPCCMKGNDGLIRFSPRPITSSRDTLVKLAITASNGVVRRADVEEALEGIRGADKSDDILRAIQSLTGKTGLTKEETLRLIKQGGRKASPEIKIPAANVSDPTDPFAN